VELRRAAFENMPRRARYGSAGSGNVALQDATCNITRTIGMAALVSIVANWASLFDAGGEWNAARRAASA
jgi:hypothetical protein